MSVDHVSPAVSPLAGTKAPTFLSVRPRDFVIVEGEQQVALQKNENWWMGQVIFCEGSARDPNANSLFQLADVDSGVIRWVNADEVTHIVRSLDGLPFAY